MPGLTRPPRRLFGGPHPCRRRAGKAWPTQPSLAVALFPGTSPQASDHCACLGVAAVGCPPRPALSPSGGRAGRFGRWTRSAVCPVQLGGPATRACSPHRGPKPARGVTVPAARGRGRGARLVASDEPHTYSADGPSPDGQHGRGCCGPSPCACACSPTERASLAPLHAACAGVGGQPTAAGDIDEWTPHPHRGRRVGEAAHPGPPSEGDPELRRQRALHALAQMQLLPPGTRPAALRDHQADTDAAEILSDTLSATTPFASPRGDAPQQLSGAVAPVTPREATPGFTPPPSPDQLPRSTPAAANVEPLPWQDARPPSSLPGERNSWLYIPLLHAGAGNLTERAQHAWRSRPGLGPRFWELASLLRDAPPVMPSALAQTLLAVAECEAHDARRDISAADRASAAAFSAMPDAPLPLSAALLLCMEPDGYLTAAAQAAFLESTRVRLRPRLHRVWRTMPDTNTNRPPRPPPGDAVAALAAAPQHTRCQPLRPANALTNVSQPAHQLPETTTPLQMRRQLESPMWHGWPWTRWTWPKSSDARCLRCKTCRPSCEPPCGQR